MNLLLLGSGGREHALAWKLRQSTHVERLWIAPGNGGTAQMADIENVPISATDVAGLIDFARANQIGLTVVGPEAPLAVGVVDAFQAAGLRIFGPTRTAAQLESSKAFAKDFMLRHDLPCAHSRAFADYSAAVAYLDAQPHLPVIKASGLAAGKGVVVPNSRDDADAALQAMLLDSFFGEAGATVLIEERLTGPELSVLAFCDGKHVRLMPGAQDHKRLLHGDLGPNTGGMGVFAPSPLFTPALREQVLETIFLPTLAGMAAEGHPYVGILYAGLMLTSEGPKLLEFNCRFGDPETQAILPLLASDLVEVLNGCIDGRLNESEINWREDSAITVVMAAGGYPADYVTGEPIDGLDEAHKRGAIVFHAGTRLEGDQVVTSGGRVLAVTGIAPSIGEAAAVAYAGIDAIHFSHAHFRNDIASAWR